MPRTTHPNRGSTRAKTIVRTDTRQHTTEALAESLVERGLASPLILEARPHAMDWQQGARSHGR